MEIKGYKGFKSNKTNRYGKPFIEGEDYHKDGPISFGNNGHGFHMCKHLSDVFRFFDPNDIVVASVIGSGEVAEGEYDDWEEPYLDMYAVSDIHIEKFLTREEIIEIMKGSSASDVVKFIATFNVTDEEAFDIVRACNSRDFDNKAKKAYLYYIKKFNIHAVEDYRESKKILEKVLDNGQDSNQRGKGK